MNCEVCGKASTRKLAVGVCSSTPECLREMQRRRARRYRDNDPERIKANMNRWHKSEKGQDHYLRRQYKMTLEQYRELLAKQGGGCAICGRPEGRLAVDHDHSCCPGPVTCGKCVRGLLCQSCNRGIGSFNDNTDLLQQAAYYLKGGSQ